MIDTFEILNEPDGRWAFTGTAADYATMLRAGHDAIAAANPRAKVAIAATMSLRSRGWLELVLGAAGPHPERLYDIANLHVRASLRALPAIMRAWRTFFAAHHAANKPLWVTEFGYPSDPAYQYDRAYRSGPASQASYLPRAPRAAHRGRCEGVRHPARQPRRSVRLRGHHCRWGQRPPASRPTRRAQTRLCGTQRPSGYPAMVTGHAARRTP